MSTTADVVVVRGSDPSFSAGLDRSAFGTGAAHSADTPSLSRLAELPAAEADALIASYQEGFAVWSDGPFLTVAAVQGHAVGAGFQLALACDLRVIAPDVQFMMKEPSLGLVPDLGGTQRLVDLVGVSRAIEICATGRAVGADEAVAIGLAHSVAPAGDLAAHVDRFVESLVGGDLAAVKATAALLRAAPGRTAQEQRAGERAAQLTQLARLRTRFTARASSES